MRKSGRRRKGLLLLLALLVVGCTIRRDGLSRESVLKCGSLDGAETVAVAEAVAIVGMRRFGGSCIAADAIVDAAPLGSGTQVAGTEYSSLSQARYGAAAHAPASAEASAEQV